MDDKPLIDKALERIRQRFDTVSEADWAMMDYVDRLARLGASVEAMGKGRDLRHSGSGHWRVLQYAVAGTPYIGLTGFHDDPQNALAEAAPTPEYEHPTSELKGTSCIPCKCIQSCEFCQRHKSYCEAKPTK